MGQTISIACPHCQYQGIFRIGKGMMCKKENIIAENLDEEAGREWLRCKEKLKNYDFSYGQMLSYCPVCREMDTCGYVDIEGHGNDGVTEATVVRRIVNHCKKCGGQVEEIAIREQAVCPVCQKQPLTWRIVGLWD